MKCLIFYETKYGIDVYERFNDDNKDCIVCNKKANLSFTTYIYRGVSYHTHICEKCIIGIKINIESVNFNFKLLQKLNLYDLDLIPNYIYYHIGRTLKMGYTDHLGANAYRIYHKTCDSARRAIREFCLYCTRYQKEVVNRDIRRKISQLIWEDKIKFLI